MKERLFTPGPVELPDRVRTVLQQQIIHHRTEEFQQAFREVRDLFKRLLESPSDNFVFFASSGTGAMEASVLNFFSEGDKVLVVNGGKFGERWLLLAQHWGLSPIEYKVSWGEAADPEYVKDLLERHPDCRGVLIQISETSTGVYHPVKEIGQLCKERDVLLVADGITALGVYRINPDEWNIDVLVGGSQKALMLPPGLSMLWFSERAAERLRNRAFYFDIKRELSQQQKGQTAWTPAISLILALRESLSILLEEGMERVERRHAAVAEGTRRAAQVMGLELFAKRPAISVTALYHEKAEEIRKSLLRYGVRTAGGQDHWKGKLIRISHMGVDPKDGLMLVGLLEVVLYKMGYSVRLGEATKVYSETLMEYRVW
ncbi:aminotransferase class V [Thermocrinis albus DSM 14484]|uniref:Aminotransferase class V n=1 Tax=Thermocrinis albus (strain DSM 14484 / JCM 11386 / HI 11/12) TaxID=638303 RepID=D3SL82_THEAH|nr:alanine--glyoxylate aminotransferase family protein [Thermocrinis albus]ADC89512.1 aminotransferase class V [Thermocrinis albus DSM 14484]